MKLDHSKGVVDDHEDNFAIVFAAMGVRIIPFHMCSLNLVFHSFSRSTWKLQDSSSRTLRRMALWRMYVCFSILLMTQRKSHTHTHTRFLRL